MTTLSVIIPAYNDLRGVLRCLNSLEHYRAPQQPPLGAVIPTFIYTFGFEFIVSDDASPDINLTELLPSCLAKVIRASENVGFAANCNAGANFTARGDILFFVNQDIYAASEWSQGWDSALVSAFDNPEVGIIGARLLFPNGAIQSAGGLFDIKGQPYHRCLGYSDPTYSEVNEPREVSWVTGAALAIRRDLFQQLGGFSTDYTGGYFEDADLCLRAKEAGFKVWYEPRCTFIHEVGSTGGNPNFMRNAALFKQRWVDTGKITADVYHVAVAETNGGWW